MKGKPADLDGEIAIGDICQYTRDTDDPRLPPTPSERRLPMSPCAGELGKLIE